MSCPMCHQEHVDSIPEALVALASTPHRLARLASVLTPRQTAARPAPDKWSAKELICHLADCEVVYGFRYRKILAEPGSTLAAFDQNAWADGLRYREQSLKAALASFRALRGQHLSLFKSLPKESWEKSAQHPEFGTLSLRQMVVHLADHDRNHTTQIKRLLPGSGRARPARRAVRRLRKRH